MSISANDCFGLPLNIGDFVISVDGSDLAGKIMDIRFNENYPWITVNDEDKPGLQKGLNPESFTTPERLEENRKYFPNNERINCLNRKTIEFDEMLSN